MVASLHSFSPLHGSGRARTGPVFASLSGVEEALAIWRPIAAVSGNLSSKSAGPGHWPPPPRFGNGERKRSLAAVTPLFPRLDEGR